MHANKLAGLRSLTLPEQGAQGVVWVRGGQRLLEGFFFFLILFFRI